MALPLSALEPGEELAGSWPRGGAGRPPPRPHPLPCTNLAKTTRLSWLGAQRFEEWVGRGPFRFSAGDLEELRKLFVPSPAGDCYSASEDGKSLGAKTVRHVITSQAQDSFPFLHEGISSEPSQCSPCGPRPCGTDSSVSSPAESATRLLLTLVARGT